MDLIREMGEAALASRLRRLSERLLLETSKVYKQEQIEFEARWYPLVALLRDRSPISVTQAAHALGLTHPAVSQLAAVLNRRGLVSAEPDERDGRRKLLALTPEGNALVEDLQPLWDAIADATREVLGADAETFLAQFAHLEQEMDRDDFSERISRHLRRGEGAAGRVQAGPGSATQQELGRSGTEG